MFFWLSLFVSPRTYSVGAICPCDIVPDVCDPNCPCDPACFPPPTNDPFPIRPPDPLPRCPKDAFNRRQKLPDFLPEEIFCIQEDNRDSVPRTTYSDQGASHFTPPPLPQLNPASSYSVRQLLANGNGTTLWIPGPEAGQSVCNESASSVRFLISSPETTCSWPPARRPDLAAFFERSQSLLPVPNLESPLLNIIDLPDTSDSGGSYIRYVFTYSPDLTIVNATRAYRIGNDVNASLTVTVAFEPQSVTVQDRPKSGEVGYAAGRPVIAGRRCSGADDAPICVSSSAAGSFPIPFGPSCAPDLKYTAAHFGVDILGGCTGTSAAAKDPLNLSEYRYFGAHGQPNPNSPADWIQLVDGDCPEVPAFQLFSFYFEKFGDVRNAQNRLIAVERTCPVATGTETRDAIQEYPWIVAVSFLQRGDQPVRRHLPPNPRAATVPEDTWRPFSSSAAVPRVAAPSAVLAALVLSIVAVLA
jgi:hypothetical protein